MRRLLVGSVAAGLLLARPAAAAPVAPCVPASVTPKATSIPANLPAFGYSAVNGRATNVHLEPSGGAEIPLTIGRTVDGYLELVPPAPLTVGVSYTLEFDPFCGYSVTPVVPLAFTATAAAPLPTKLGDAKAPPVVTLKDFGQTQVAIAATYTLAPEMKPWAGVYRVAMRFDGTIVETEPKVNGAGELEITATGWCDAASAAKGTHVFQLEGSLPFAPPVAAPAVNVDFACPAPKLGALPNDPAKAPNGAVSPAADGGTAPTTSASSGCSLGLRPAASWSLATVGMLLALATRLRRSRSRSRASAATRRR